MPIGERPKNVGSEILAGLVYLSTIQRWGQSLATIDTSPWTTVGWVVAIAFFGYCYSQSTRYRRDWRGNKI